MQKDGFVIDAFPAKDFSGKDRAVVVAKGTWQLQDSLLTPSKAPEPFAYVDKFEDPDNPMRTPILFEADTAFEKTGTDIILMGTAYAPGEKAVPSFTTRLQVGGFVRTLLIQGPRRASFAGSERNPKPPTFSKPTPVKQLEISFKYAYGGITRYALPDGSDPVDLPCPTNPLGQGYVVQALPELIDGLALPQIEFPDRPLTPQSLVQNLGSSELVPIPAGLGFYGKAWMPRVDLLGVMPYELESVKKTMAEYGRMSESPDMPGPVTGFEPPVMRPDFFNSAAPYNVMKPFLKGNETVVMANLTKNGKESFYLPGVVPLIKLDSGNGPKPVEMVMDTLVFLPDEGRVITIFRGSRILTEPDAADHVADMPVIIDIGLDKK